MTILQYPSKAFERGVYLCLQTAKLLLFIFYCDEELFVATIIELEMKIEK